MEEIRDCNGRIACKGNATTGLIEVLTIITKFLFTVNQIFD